MISKHVHYEAAHDSYGALARYIADASHEGEKCLVSWCAGCAADDDYELAIVEAQAVQALNTRSTREKTYHLLVSFHPEDEAKLTPETFKAIEERFAAVLGYVEHQRHCGVHKNTGNIHMHIAYNMVHPERYARHEPFRDYALRDTLCRELEQELGVSVDNGREQKQDNALSHKAATIEAQTGQESFESYAKRHKLEIMQTLEQAHTWQDMHEALQTYGLGIKPHGNGLVIKDRHGEHAIKASTLDRSLSASKLQERFGAFQPYRSLRHIQERSCYQPVPLHRSPERGKLFASYQEGINARKAILENIKQQEDKQFAAIRQEWEHKRREIESMSMAKRNRRNLLALARKHEKEALAKAKLALQPQREAVRREIPYTSWQDYLKVEAENGNEIALAVLRSRKETIAPETALEPVQSPQSSPTKDWSQHGLGYAATLQAKHEYAAKERELQERQDLSASGKKTLHAVLHMEQTIAEAQVKGKDPGSITHRIDGKGIVIFTLASGGSIRDTGREIFYSGHDQKAQEIAALYAAKKWGKQLVIGKGCISFVPNRQQEHHLNPQDLELPVQSKGISR